MGSRNFPPISRYVSRDRWNSYPPPLGSIHLERRRIDANATRERISLRDPVHPTELGRHERTIGTRLTFDMAMPDAISLDNGTMVTFFRGKNRGNIAYGESSCEVMSFENESVIIEKIL